MAILNYTTKISSDKTVGEIQSMLIRKGVQSVNTEVKDRRPSAICFVLDIQGKYVSFRLPCNVDGVLKAMQRDNKIPRANKTMDQAERTAWRIIKDWVEAQMAIVEGGQAVMEEVFLPYCVMPATNQTLFQVFKENSQKLLNS